MTVTVTVKVSGNYTAKVRQGHGDIVKIGADSSQEFHMTDAASHDRVAQDHFEIEETFNGDPVSEDGKPVDGSKGPSPRGNKTDIVGRGSDGE